MRQRVEGLSELAESVPVFQEHTDVLLQCVQSQEEWNGRVHTEFESLMHRVHDLDTWAAGPQLSHRQRRAGGRAGLAPPGAQGGIQVLGTGTSRGRVTELDEEVAEVVA